MSESSPNKLSIGNALPLHKSPCFDGNSWPCDGQECPSYRNRKSLILLRFHSGNLFQSLTEQRVVVFDAVVEVDVDVRLTGIHPDRVVGLG